MSKTMGIVLGTSTVVASKCKAPTNEQKCSSSRRHINLDRQRGKTAALSCDSRRRRNLSPKRKERAPKVSSLVLSLRPARPSTTDLMALPGVKG